MSPASTKYLIVFAPISRLPQPLLFFILLYLSAHKYKVDKKAQ